MEAESMDRSHTTKNEIEFIQELGTFSLNPKPRVPLLNKYLQSCLEREDWGDIDRAKILDKTCSELAEERKREARKK